MKVMGRDLPLSVTGVITYGTVTFSTFIVLMFRSWDFCDSYRIEKWTNALGTTDVCWLLTVVVTYIAVKHSTLRNDELCLLSLNFIFLSVTLEAGACAPSTSWPNVFGCF